MFKPISKILTMISFCAIAALLACESTEAENSQDRPPAKEGQQCGTIQGIVCEPELWCDYREGACGGADLDGVCVKIPDICTEEYNPVCGCDGTSYSNDCARIKARAQKDHKGECEKGKQDPHPS